jgi:electron transport complex protein RnfB
MNLSDYDFNFARVAFIREDECIGCTKCIQVCPVDAILGAAKKMHTVIGFECTGCEHCVAACPVDCIDLLPIVNACDEGSLKEQLQLAEKRYYARERRLQDQLQNAVVRHAEQQAQKRKAEIMAAVQRVRDKKNG